MPSTNHWLTILVLVFAITTMALLLLVDKPDLKASKEDFDNPSSEPVDNAVGTGSAASSSAVLTNAPRESLSAELTVLDVDTQLPVPRVAVVLHDLRVDAPAALAARGSTDDQGRIAISLVEDFATIILVHDSYAVEEIQRIDIDASSPHLVHLRKRPTIRTVLSNTDVSVISAHQFSMSVQPERAALYSRLTRLLGHGIIKDYAWSGFGYIDLQSPDYGPCTLVAGAHRGENIPTRRATVDFKELQIHNFAEVAFHPDLDLALCDVTIDVDVNFPADAKMEVYLIGPARSMDGPILTRNPDTRHFEASTNERSTHLVSNIRPGTYDWGAVVKGYGTYRMGRVKITGAEPDKLVLLHNQKEFVENTVRIAPQLAKGLDKISIIILDGFRTAHSHAFRPPETGQDKVLEHRFVVEKNVDLWAMTYIHLTTTTSRPVRLPTDTDGGVVSIEQPAELFPIRFNVTGPLDQNSVQWLEICDLESGMIRTTRADSVSVFGPTLFPSGSYSARVYKDDRVSPPVYFKITQEETIDIVH